MLQKFFNMNSDNDTTIMLKIHTQGKAICGIYPFDIAETKVNQINIYSRHNGHPLLCTLEKN